MTTTIVLAAVVATATPGPKWLIGPTPTVPAFHDPGLAKTASLVRDMKVQLKDAHYLMFGMYEVGMRRPLDTRNVMRMIDEHLTRCDPEGWKEAKHCIQATATAEAKKNEPPHKAR